MLHCNWDQEDFLHKSYKRLLPQRPKGKKEKCQHVPTGRRKAPIIEEQRIEVSNHIQALWDGTVEEGCKEKDIYRHGAEEAAA